MSSLVVVILKPFNNFKQGEEYPAFKKDCGKYFVYNPPFGMNEIDFDWRKRKGFIKLVMREIRTMRNDQGQ